MSKSKRENFLLKIIRFLTEEEPLHIEQQESKKFALFYDYDIDYIIRIIIVLKDKFINLSTHIQLKKKTLKE